MDIFGSIQLFVLIWIGVAVLWSLRLAYRKRGAVADDSIRLILTIAGWILILAGILGTAMQAFVFGAPVYWLVILAIVMMAVGRYRGAENRTLLWCLAKAAERGIPLEQAARAYSLERSDELGIRAARLADLLEGGTPLSLALAETRVSMPLDALVAVRVGIETGDLGSALAKITKYDDDADSLLRSVFEKIFYLAVVANVLVGILTFIMLKIVPVYAKMFEEFGLELPRMTQLLVAISDYSVSYWFVPFAIFAWLPLCLFFGLLHYVGWLPPEIWLPRDTWLPRGLRFIRTLLNRCFNPTVNRFTVQHDSSLVMRCLALSIQQQRPLLEMIWLLATLYPKASVRERLTQAGEALNNGEHWCQALRQVKLLRASEVAVLTAAERSGNLEWALEEMADSSIRNLAYHLRLALNVLFPLVLFVFGMLIAFVVVSLFMPLISLIQGLS